MKIIFLIFSYYIFYKEIKKFNPFDVNLRNKKEVSSLKDFVSDIFLKNKWNHHFSTNITKKFEKVNTYYYKENDFTTGNGMKIDNALKYIPVNNIKENNPKNLIKEIKILEKISSFADFLIIDVFNEDSRKFSPESKSYFNNINKRSSLFDILAKILLVILIILLLNKKYRNKKLNNTKFNKRKINILIILETIGFFFILFLSIKSLYIISKENGNIKDFGINLINKFKKLRKMTTDLSKNIDDFNIKNYNIHYYDHSKKIYNYKVKNIIKQNLKFYRNIFKKTKKIMLIFNNSNKFTFIPIILTFYSFIGLIILFYPIKHKSFKFQFIIFLISSFLLFFILLQIGSYFSQLTLFHDVCKDIADVKSLNFLPLTKSGIMNYIDCEYQESLNYQIINFIYIINSSLSEYNQRLIELKNEEIFSLNELIFKYDFIKKIKINDSILKEKFEILNTMRNFIKTLIPFKNCKIFKEWINNSTTPFCLDILEKLFIILKIYLLIIIVFVILLIILYQGQKIIKEYKIHSILKFNKKSKLRYFSKIN